MGFVLRFLGRAVVVLGWCVFVLLAAAFLAEETGALTSLARDVIATRLGALGHDLSIDHVRLSWFEPGLELEGVELGRDAEMVALSRVHFTCELFGEHGFGVSRVQVEGGHVCLSSALTIGLESAAARTKGARPWAASDVALPAIELRGVELSVESQRWKRLPIGRLDADVHSGREVPLALEGRLVPTLADPSGASGGEPGEIQLTGRLSSSGEIEIHAAAVGVLLATESLPPDADVGPLRPFQPSGILDVQGHGRFSLDGNQAPDVRVRLSLRNGTAKLAGGRQRLERVRADVEASYAPQATDGTSALAAWQANAQCSGEWDGRAFEGYGWLGRGREPGLSAKAWLHAPRLALSRGLMEIAGETPKSKIFWDALNLRGSADAWAAVQCSADASSDSDPWSRLEYAAEIDLAGDAGLTYRGWPSHASGQADQGFPLPLDQITGEVLYAWHPDRAKPAIVGLVGLAGQHGADTIHASGWVGSHDRHADATLPGVGYAELDLALSTARLTVDDALRTALAGLSGAVDPKMWRAFNPSGGGIAVDLRVARTVLMHYASIDLRLGLADLALTWKDLPIPLGRTHGELTFRSDGMADGRLTCTARGELSTAKQLVLDLAYASDPSRQPTGHGKTLDERISITVDVERGSLTGDDKKLLVKQFPDIGALMDPMSPRGFVDLHYERVRAHPLAETVSTAEIKPLDPAQLTPEEFKMVTSDVRGRVLVATIQPPPPSAADDPTATPPTHVETRIAPLVGIWDQKVLVALTASFPENVIDVYGAGINPSSKSLLGSLSRAIQKPGDVSAVDLTALTVEGFVDLKGRIQLAREPSVAPDKSYRVFLRNNSLVRAGNLRLDGLEGVLDLSDDVWRGGHLVARLADTAVALDDLSFKTTAEGYELDAVLRAENLPLDREHLRSFVDAKTLDTLVSDLKLTGTIDIEDGHVSISGPRQGEGRLVVSGKVMPNDMSIQLGMPVAIRSASATIERLILEGGKMRAHVRLEDLYGSLADRELGPANLLVTYVEPRLSLENLNGQFEKGVIQALGRGATREETAFSIDLEEPFPFHLALDLRNVAIEGLLRGLIPSNVSTKGQADCQLLLTGDTENVLAIQGSGSVLVRSSRLWSVPVFRALFSRLGLDDTAVFDSMAANVRVANGVIHMSDIAVHSPLLQLAGKGSIDFDGRLKHDLEVHYDLVDRLGPITRMLYAIQNELLSISIRGDLSRPQVILKNPISRLFGGSSGTHALPLPGYAPLPPRF